MELDRDIYVVGGDLTPFIGKGHPDFDEDGDNPSLEDHLTTAIEGAFEETDVEPAQIDRGYVGNFAGECFSNQGHLGAMAVRADSGLEGKPFQRVEGACASGGLATVDAIDTIRAGTDVALVAGAEVQTTVSAREGAGYLARAAHWEEERELDDFTFPAMFARRTKHYKEAYGATEEELAKVVVKAYENASKNPNAHMREVDIDLDHAACASEHNPNFLRNEELKPHLKMTDCSQVSDGAAAMVVASREGLDRLGVDPTECAKITAYGVATSPLGRVDDYTELGNTRQAVGEVYEDAGIGPNDLDVAEVHDCFAVTEPMMYEALGLADRGHGVELIEEGATEIDGETPVNTGGGLIAFGHPVGATGVKQVLELYRQMKGECGEYQIPDRPEVGLTANMGGDDRTTVSIALQNLG